MKKRIIRLICLVEAMCIILPLGGCAGKKATSVSPVRFTLCTLLCVLTVFVIGSGFDIARKYLVEKPFMKLFDKFTDAVVRDFKKRKGTKTAS